jgi:hypothetical protein
MRRTIQYAFIAIVCFADRDGVFHQDGANPLFAIFAVDYEILYMTHGFAIMDYFLFDDYGYRTDYFIFIDFIGFIGFISL